MPQRVACLVSIWQVGLGIGSFLFQLSQVFSKYNAAKRTYVTLALMSSANVLTLLRNSPTATAAFWPPSLSTADAMTSRQRSLRQTAERHSLNVTWSSTLQTIYYKMRRNQNIAISSVCSKIFTLLLKLCTHQLARSENRKSSHSQDQIIVREKYLSYLKQEDNG